MMTSSPSRILAKPYGNQKAQTDLCSLIAAQLPEGSWDGFNN